MNVADHLCHSLTFLSSYHHVTDIQTVVENAKYNVMLNSNTDDVVDDWQVPIKERVSKSCRCGLLDWEDIGNIVAQQGQQSSGTEHAIPLGDIDVIIGSELTYTENPDSISNLVQVVDAYLKPGGVFIEILSDNREGVGNFVNLAESQAGIVCERFEVSIRYLDHVGIWQRPETYTFHLFSRKEHRDTSQTYARFRAAFRAMRHEPTAQQLLHHGM